MDDITLKEYWTLRDLAEFWGVSYQKVRHAAWEGTIPGCRKTPTGHIEVHRETVVREWKPASMKGWLEGYTPGTQLVRRTAEERMHTLSVTVTQDNWVQVIKKAVSQAVNGDYRARQWLSNYLLGPPIQRLVAKVELEEVGGFEAGFRAAAVQALLGEVRSRAEAQIVDVTPEVENASA